MAHDPELSALRKRAMDRVKAKWGTRGYIRQTTYAENHQSQYEVGYFDREKGDVACGVGGTYDAAIADAEALEEYDRTRRTGR